MALADLTSVRVSVFHPDGVLSSGVAELVRKMTGSQAVSAFKDWAANPITVLFRNALRDMALNGPPVAESSEIAVQYGMSLGLGLAAQLVDDPSVVFQQVFRDPAATPPNNPSFEYSLDDAIAHM